MDISEGLGESASVRVPCLWGRSSCYSLSQSHLPAASSQQPFKYRPAFKAHLSVRTVSGGHLEMLEPPQANLPPGRQLGAREAWLSKGPEGGQGDPPRTRSVMIMADGTGARSHWSLEDTGMHIKCGRGGSSWRAQRHYTFTQGLSITSPPLHPI